MNLIVNGLGTDNKSGTRAINAISSGKGSGLAGGGNRFVSLDLFIEKLAKSNKLGFLLEKHTKPVDLKRLLLASLHDEWELKKRSKNEENNKIAESKGIALAERVFSFLEEYYGGQYRRNGTTPAVCHPLSVALGISRLGCSFETVITALLHDVIEDKHMAVKRADFENLLGEKLGKRVYENVKLLSRKKSMNYDTYMDKITSSRKLDVMLVKVIDTIENLKSISYTDILLSAISSNEPADALRILSRNQFVMSEIDKMRNAKADISDVHILNTLSSLLMEKKTSSVDKALAHIEIWKKVNSDLYLLIVGLIKDANPPEKYLKRLEGFLYPSTRTVGYLDAGYADLTWRGELNRSLFWLLPDEGIPKHPDYDFGDLPDQGFPVITIYDPSQYQNAKYAHDTIEIEIPMRAVERVEAEGMLDAYFPFMGSKWKRAKSVLPSGLECSAIYRAKRQSPSDNALFLYAVKQLSHDLFYAEQQKIIMELLGKSNYNIAKSLSAKKPEMPEND
ncbi:MAG: HD domain-containing protein [Candidatus Micrarchaeia archaeon]